MKFGILMLLAAAMAFGQYPEPCMPGQAFDTEQFPPSDGCSPVQCYSAYVVTFDSFYGIACDAYCVATSSPACSPDRVTITSGPSQCSVDLARCSISYPYYCVLITSETDVCNGELCSQTQGNPYCTNQQPTGELKEGNHAKAVLAALRARNR